MQLGSGIAVAVCRSAATALIGPLTWESPYAAGEALKTKTTTKKDQKIIPIKWKLNKNFKKSTLQK